MRVRREEGRRDPIYRVRGGEPKITSKDADPKVSNFLLHKVYSF